MPNWKKVITSGSEASLNKLVVDGSIGHVSASLFSGSFYGDGSNLTGLGDSAFQNTGSMTVLNADSADTATEVNIATLTTAGGKDILYTGDGSSVSQDTSGEFTYNPDSNLLSVGDIATGKIVVTQTSHTQAIEILNTNARWKQYIDSFGHITLNASGSGTTNVNYTLESGHFNVNLNDRTKDFRVKASSSIQVLNVTGDGKVGIGPSITNSPQQDVHISGSVRLQDYGSGTKTGTLAYTLGVDSSGDIIETTGGSDTNIANTDLTANANRTLTMSSNNLTFDEVNVLTVNTSNGGLTLNSSEETFLTGIANSAKPHMLYWDSNDGRIVYASTGSIPGTTYTAGTGISINGSNVISSTVTGATGYTPRVWYITNTQTYTSSGTLIKTDSSILLNGTTPVTRSTTADGTFSFDQAGWYEVTYSFVVESKFTNRANIGAKCTYDTGTAEVNLAGSYSTEYVRDNDYGQYAHSFATFYVYTTDYSTNTSNDLKLYTYLLYGSMNMETKSAPHNTISFRYLGT